MTRFSLAIAALAAIGVSCTFPSVTYNDGDASIPFDAGGDGASDASADVITTNDANTPCDEDNDGYLALSCEGGNDCNDHDARMHPDAGWVYDVPDTGPLLGDWNCDGTVEYRYATVITLCATQCNAEGFTTSTGCGVMGDLEVCDGGGLCGTVDRGTQTQGCE